MPDPALLAPFILAPVIGSFLGVLIRRIPREQAFVGGRSQCETCGTPLRAHELVPLLSWLIQRGRCRHCKTAIDPLHLQVELAAFLPPLMALIIPLALHEDPQSGTAWADPTTFAFVSVLGWGLLALAWIDCLCFRLPDVLTLPLLLIGLLDGYISGGIDGAGERAVGAALGWGGLVLIGALYRRTRGRAGLGGGDAKLLGVAGAWLGYSLLPSVLILASCLGLAMALSIGLRRHSLSMTLAIPFGPALAAAIWIVRLATAQP